ncbi:MAG: hypothetical protein QOI23_2684 [Chloroflexota bacterium]|jgi:hypothetical protein|nr:hypothetical protein [Chloroflexota bacterium]
MRFSLESYGELIRSALQAGFAPATFNGDMAAGRNLLLRHDIDYSLDMALRLARVNADLGVAGTFFVLLRGHAYNPLSKTSLVRLTELVSLGQHLGLHVPGGLEANLSSDFKYLASQIPLDPVFSWHNPTPELLRNYRDRETVEGLTNVYASRFLDEALYRSDSNFGKTYEELAAAFGAGRSTVHLLLHPINWVAGGTSMIEVFEHAWPYLIRESELEARTNRVYAESLPDGMPDTLLAEFSRRWRETVG